jgi:hypothetical protein
MMQDDKLIALLDRYTRDEITKKPLAEHGAAPQRLPATAYGELFDLCLTHDEQQRSAALKHAAWMAAEAPIFLKKALKAEKAARDVVCETVGEVIPTAHAHAAASRALQSAREKAHRWLGFIQGVLWLSGVFTLDELKEHSRKCSDEPDKPETTT